MVWVGNAILLFLKCLLLSSPFPSELALIDLRLASPNFTSFDFLSILILTITVLIVVIIWYLILHIISIIFMKKKVLLMRKRAKKGDEAYVR